MSTQAMGWKRGKAPLPSSEVATKSLRTETLGISPQVGVLGYTTGDGTYVTRGATGLTFDGNLGKSLLSDSGPLKDFYLGFTTARSTRIWVLRRLTFSEVTRTIQQCRRGSSHHSYELEVGYYLSDNIRISAHGGGNLIYTSAAQSVNFGQGSWDSGAKWNYFPNAGGDLEVALTL